MTKLRLRLATALSTGRRLRAPGSLSRESILAGLLRQRAAARAAGLDDLERKLRAQILWSLPMHRPADDVPPGGPDPDPAAAEPAA